MRAALASTEEFSLDILYTHTIPQPLLACLESCLEGGLLAGTEFQGLVPVKNARALPPCNGEEIRIRSDSEVK